MANSLKIKLETAAANPQHSISSTRRSLNRCAWWSKRSETISVPATIKRPPVTCKRESRSPSTKYAST
jgi:hypothetical protein